MKTSRAIHLALGLAIASAMGAIPSAAEADALLQIHHRVGAPIPAGPGPALVQIEVRNLGPDAADEAAIVAEGPQGAAMGPLPMVVGRLEPGEARVLSQPLLQPDGEPPIGPIMWRVDYLDAEGNPQQVLVPGIGSAGGQ